MLAEFWLALAGVLFLLGASVLVYAMLVERNWYRIREISIEALPHGSEPLRILQLSDLHLRPGQARKRRWIAGLGRLKPNLVVNTGDNLGGAGSIAALGEGLIALRGVPGVFVHGSNDYHAPRLRNPFSYLSGPSSRSGDTPLEIDDMEQTFSQLGWLNLNNRATQLRVGNSVIRLVGVNDPHEERDDFEAAERDLSRVAEASQRPPDFVIGLAHAPYLGVLAEFANLKVDLVVAGHTHGGQVCLPGGRAIVTNCDLPPKFARGLSAWKFGDKELLLHVCAGLGTSVFAPFRLFCRPEVALIELLPVRDAAAYSNS